MIYHQLKPIPNEYFPFQSNVIWLLRGISILDLVSDGIKCDCPSALYQNKSSSHHVMAFYPFIAVKWNLNFRESRGVFNKHNDRCCFEHWLSHIIFAHYFFTSLENCRQDKNKKQVFYTCCNGQSIHLGCGLKSIFRAYGRYFLIGVIIGWNDAETADKIQNCRCNFTIVCISMWFKLNGNQLATCLVCISSCFR